MQECYVKNDTSEVVRDRIYKGLITLATNDGYMDIRWTFSCDEGSPPSVVFTDGSREIVLFNYPDEKRNALLYMVDICMADRKSGRRVSSEVVCSGTEYGMMEILRLYKLI